MMATGRLNPHEVAGSLLCFFLIAFLALAPAASATPEQEGCRFPILIDYSAPLRQMAPVRHPPGPNGQLPFGPHGLTLKVSSPTVLVGKGNLALQVISRLDPVELNWTVVSQLARVRPSGAAAELLWSKRQRLRGPHASLTIQFKVGHQPAFYRIQSTFFDSSGHRLGSYAEYFRVVKPRTKVRESVSPTVAHGGDVLVTRTEDLGTIGIGLGNDWAIERFEGGEWIIDPVTPKGFAGVAFTISGGFAYECRQLRLPMDMSPGQYRFHKVIKLPPGGPKRDLYAEFVIAP